MNAKKLRKFTAPLVIAAMVAGMSFGNYAKAVLTTINVIPATLTIATGATFTMTAQTLDENGVPTVDVVTWSTSDPTVATIDATTGLLTAVADGTATITATSGVITGTATVTVYTPALTTINVAPTTPTVAAGATQQFTATTLDQQGLPIVAVVTWSSSDPTVGTIDATSGLFTGVAAGTTTVSATSGLISGSTLTTVTAVVVPVLTTINVTPVTPTVATGATQQFTAATLDQNGNPIVAVVTWSSSNPAAGTIDATTGLFTAVAAGTTTVTATSGLVTGSTLVTVSAVVQTLTSITVSPANPSVLPTGTQQFTAQGRDQFGNPMSVTVTWSSSSPAVGTIDATSGLFTAVGLGTTTVSATSGLISGSTTVTVTTTAVAPTERRGGGDRDDDLPVRPTIIKSFGLTRNSITFPIKFSRRKSNHVIITVKMENLKTGKITEQQVETKMNHDGRKKITVDSLLPMTPYKFQVKVKKADSEAKALFSRSRTATTL